MKKALLLSLLLSLACLAAAAEVNVTDFGARGDGETDDTAAFVQAIEAAGSGGTVRVPFGKYVITDSLYLDGVTLAGNTDAAWPADDQVLPLIMPKSL